MSKGSRNELQVFHDGLQDMSRRQIKVSRLTANYEPQANKSFLIQQFFKNAGEVQGEQP